MIILLLIQYFRPKAFIKLGLRGRLPTFIENFLAYRTMQVRVGSSLSDYYDQEQGVPQGGVLSTTLFSIKINDIVKCLGNLTDCSLYVDDFCICYRSKSMATIERQLQQNLNEIENWATSNGFKFSKSKTQCVHFCQLRKLHDETVLHSYGLLQLDYGCIIYGSARKSYLQMLDPIHNQGLRLALGAFRTSVASLYVEEDEPSLYSRREKLSLQYAVRLAANPSNPAYEVTFPPNYVDLYEQKPKAIKSFGIRISPLLETANIKLQNIEEHFTPNIPAWCMKPPEILFDLHSGKNLNQIHTY